MKTPIRCLGLPESLHPIQADTYFLAMIPMVTWDVEASYYPDSAHFSLFDPFSPSIAHLYQFNFTGTDAITGCFYIFEGGMFSDCFPLEGFRISTSSVQGSNVRNINMGESSLRSDFSRVG